jgi:hypothetical protein
MSATLQKQAADRHPVLPDIGKPRMAKVDVRFPDETQNITGEDIGRAVQRAVLMVWGSNKEAAADLQVDDAEFGKWLSGARRPQFDKLFAIRALRVPLCVELSRLSGADVHTHIEFRRPV